MNDDRNTDFTDALNRLKAFRREDSPDRLFVHPIGHPSSPTGFCFCDHSFFKTLGMCVKGGLLDLVLKLPFNKPKPFLLRRLGARIGKNVYISPGVWIDPVYTDLLTIEDDVFMGMFGKITLHEYRIDEFRAGRVILRKGSFIGAAASIGCGVEVGEGATVAAGAVLGRDVPAGATALGNPARIVNREDIPPAD